MSTAGAAFATTHGVIDRVHDYAAVAGTTTEPAAAACLTGTLQRVLAVADNAYCSLAGTENLAGLARR